MYRCAGAPKRSREFALWLKTLPPATRREIEAEERAFAQRAVARMQPVERDYVWSMLGVHEV